MSAATILEISIKRELGQLSAPEDMSSIVEENGFIELPITLFHGDQAGLLPNFHKDPFDRMLIAQAQAEGLVLVTHNSNIKKYGIRTLDPF